jgi:hypothetical protein
MSGKAGSHWTLPHLPLVQGKVHTLPHSPQLFRSEERSTHVPLQQVSGFPNSLVPQGGPCPQPTTTGGVPGSGGGPGSAGGPAAGGRPGFSGRAAQAAAGTEASTPPRRTPPIHLSGLRREIVPLASPRASSSRGSFPSDFGGK